MNMQTSRPGFCYPVRLISLIALNILGLSMNAIAANDFSTIASSQQQLQLIFTPDNRNFFTDKNLSHIDHIASIEAQVYDVNNTFPFADDESMSASTSWFRDVSSLSITCENCLSSKREEEYYFLIASNELGLTTTSSSYASAYYSSADHGSGISTKIKKGWFMHACDALHQRSYFLPKSTMWHPSTNISLQMLSWTPFSPQNIELGTNISPRNVELGTNVIHQNTELDTNGFSYAYANTLRHQLLSPGSPYSSHSYHYVFSLLTPTRSSRWSFFLCDPYALNCDTTVYFGHSMHGKYMFPASSSLLYSAAAPTTSNPVISKFPPKRWGCRNAKRKNFMHGNAATLRAALVTQGSARSCFSRIPDEGGKTILHTCVV